MMNIKLRQIVITFFLFMSLSANYAADKKVNYSLKITDAAHHLAEVTVLFPMSEAESVDFIMPAWRLGKYTILDLANGIRHFNVTDTNGKQLSVKKIDKNTWRVKLNNPTKLAVSYQLYANGLNTRTRHIDDTHAYLDGASSFIYSPEFMSNELIVELDVPNPWRSQSGMKRLGKHRFTANNYDILASSPIETGVHDYYQFSADNRDYEVVIWGKGNFNGPQIVKDYKKMVVEHGKMWGGYPFKRYLFIIHATTNVRGATEHINSTVIQTEAMGFTSKEDYRRFISTSSHEFVHTWNVKAYRPKGIQVYDYEKENYSDLLWIAEGSTNYFGELLLVRSGLLDPKIFLEALAEKVQKYLDRPGRKVMSANEASFDRWIEGGGDRANNASVNIYTKGNLLSLLMDVELLKATNAEKGYAEVHKLLYERFPVNEKGFTADDIKLLMQEISTKDFSEMWQTNMESTGEIDFTSLFDSLGLQFSRGEESNEEGEISDTVVIYTGLVLSESSGDNKVTGVPEGSPAWKANLAPDDVLLAINGIKIEPGKFRLLLEGFNSGDEVKVTYFRRNLLKETNMELSKRSSKSLKLLPIDNASELQKRMYTKWLGVEWEEKKDSQSEDKK